MSEERGKSSPQEFLSRWSRLKSEARDERLATAAPEKSATDAGEPVPELPPLDELSITSDFRPFFHPKVDEGLRRAALKKLFSDPHFNVMDGLDVYIDDYSQPSPLPAEMLAQLSQAQNILRWAQESKDEAAASEVKKTAAHAEQSPAAVVDCKTDPIVPAVAGAAAVAAPIVPLTKPDAHDS